MKYLIPVVSSMLLVGCFGGGGGDDSAPASSADSTDTATATTAAIVEVNTGELVAARDFGFDVGETISFSVNYQGDTEGALHLYTEAAYVAEDGTVTPDPLSRITTIYPSKTSQVALEVNSNWQALYAQWVPMSASEPEQNWQVTLDQNGHYHLDI